MTRIRPEERADPRQVENMRADWIAAVNAICDRELKVQRYAQEHSRGPSSSVAQGVSGGGISSVVENCLDDNGSIRWDPAHMALDATVERKDAYSQTMRVADKYITLTTPAELKPPRDAATICERSECKRVITGMEKDDPNKSGYCSECFGDWQKLGRPERIDFNRMSRCAECGEVAVKVELPEWFDGNKVHHRTLKAACYQAAYRRVKQSA